MSVYEGWSRQALWPVCVAGGGPRKDSRGCVCPGCGPAVRPRLRPLPGLSVPSPRPPHLGLGTGVCHPKASPAKRNEGSGYSCPSRAQTRTFRALQGPTTCVTLPHPGQNCSGLSWGPRHWEQELGLGAHVEQPLPSEAPTAPVCSCHFIHADWAFPGVQVSHV